jgi:glycosyltransferase involved in cell wall biosynthesis
VLSFFGQIRGYKGVEELARAFVATDSPDSLLVVAGWLRDPALGERLERIQRDDDRLRLRFEFLPDEAVVDLIRASDAVVLPYLRSLTSGSAILAASCGRPVVASRLGCLAEWPDETGIFFDPVEPGALGRALRLACEVRDLDQRGRAAREYVGVNDWETIARLLTEWYRELLDDREHGSGEV